MPIRAVEAAVLDCFGEVFGADVVGVVQVGDGAGIYHVSPQVLKLTVPQDTLAATYTSAATIAVATGP